MVFSTSDADPVCLSPAHLRQQQLLQINSQSGGKLVQNLNIRAGYSAFPFGNRLRRHPAYTGEVLLRQGGSAPQGTDAVREQDSINQRSISRSDKIKGASVACAADAPGNQGIADLPREFTLFSGRKTPLRRDQGIRMILFRTFVTASFHPDFCCIPAVVLPAGDAAGISYHKIRCLSINRRLFFLFYCFGNCVYSTLC